MITVGNGVLSSEDVHTNQQYLARIAQRYLVIVPIDPLGAGRLELPYLEAVFIDPLDRKQKPFTDIYEIAPIY